MKLIDIAIFLWAFVSTRWKVRFRDRAAFERWQARRLNKFLKHRIGDAAFYRDHAGAALTSLPIVDKSITLAQFNAFNVRGITLADATAAAIAAENAGKVPEGFDPTLTAGLSSGTQGPHGIFLATTRERAAWAGILLARTLDRALLEDLFTRRAPLRVAFFLRANSSLYMTLKRRRVDFRFFNLQQGIQQHAAALTELAPDILVAPASVLAWLAAETSEGRLSIKPRRVISVAEVLEPGDEQRIRHAYGETVHQLYQCTEGFLAYTCEHGTLHLNEEFVHIEPEWIDANQTRFTPIVTDFTRRTQMIVRYRLNDILRLRTAPCACGRVTRTLAAIDGRMDDVLWLASAHDGRLRPLFPDIVRYVITRTAMLIPDYRIEQHAQQLHLAIAGKDADDAVCDAYDAYATITGAIDQLVVEQHMQPLAWQRIPMPAASPGAKRRRIVCVEKPSLSAVMPLQPRSAS